MNGTKNWEEFIIVKTRECASLMKELSNTKNDLDQYFTAGMIGNILNLSASCVRERIRKLELYPVAMNGNAKYYHHSAIQYVKDNQPNFKYLIFQSKINNPNFEL